MIIPSVAWVQSYRLKQTRFQHLYKDFLKTKTTELVNKLIIDPIVEEMRANDVSRKIWENVVVGNVIIGDTWINISVHSEYFAENGFDVALAREEGTDQDSGGKHWVRPKDPSKSLSWISGGKRVYSKGHEVSGLPRLNIIQRIVESGEYVLQNKLNDEYRKWKESVFE